MYYFRPQYLRLLQQQDRLHLLSVAHNRPGVNTSYRDKLLQAALWKDAVQLRPERPLCKNGKHHALQNHGLGPLKHSKYADVTAADCAPGVRALSHDRFF